MNFDTPRFQSAFLLTVYLLLAFCAAFPALAHDDMESSLSVKAERTDTKPVLDGELNEPFWAGAEAIESFWQRNPDMGAPATFPISIKIAYDSETIYIGFEIHSGDPAGLVSTVLQRDGGVNSYDDHFGFRFDTFHDHRDTYYFYINPKGTRLDGHAIDEGVKSDDNWDGVWQVRTKITEDGWQGEIALPIYNFRFGNVEEAIWGFGGMVYVSATQENVSWPNMQKQTRKPSLFGHITGIKGLDRKQPFVFTPYLLGGSAFGRSEKTEGASPGWRSVDDSFERDMGLDIRYRPTSNIEANIALNPDFATVEADQFLFNLTADELQHPEKRPFFTEGQSRFETPIQLLYTRRIGLSEDEVIAGGKLHGQVGNYDFGVLDVLTGDGFDSAYNYSALRVKRDILRSSTIGFLAVGKHDADSEFAEVNSAAAIDMNYQISGATSLVGQLARSSRPDNGGDGYAGDLSFRHNYPLFSTRDALNWSTTISAATDDFDIGDIGYFGRSSLDRRGLRNSVGYSYWVKSHGINRFNLTQNSWYYQDYDGKNRVQDGLSLGGSVQSSSLIAPGFLVEDSYYFFPSSGEKYDNTNRTVMLTIGPYPRFRSKLLYRTGDNFGSAIHYFDSELILKISNQMRITSNFSHLESDLHDSPLPTSVNDIARIGFNYLFTPDLYWRLFVQSDSHDELSLVNTLLRWEYRPGSVFYLSYKETRDDTLDDFMPTDRRVLMKLSYHLHR